MMKLQRTHVVEFGMLKAVETMVSGGHAGSGVGMFCAVTDVGTRTTHASAVRAKDAKGELVIVNFILYCDRNGMEMKLCWVRMVWTAYLGVALLVNLGVLFKNEGRLQMSDLAISSFSAYVYVWKCTNKIAFLRGFLFLLGLFRTGRHASIFPLTFFEQGATHRFSR